ncbi:MAG: peptidase U49, Lit peptidase [Proteobacteria bacterium]|nr:peptidase U49, Lit peptidase [Pseudomonadota bacterium]
MELPSPEDIIKALMKGATPERSDEIDTLWVKYHPKVVVADDGPGITLDATKERIKFNPKTMEVFWLIGFSGWRAIECYSPHVVLSAPCGKTLTDLFDDDSDLPEVERDYKEKLAAARRLIAELDAGAAPWPEDLPRPSSDRNAIAGPQYQAAFDLTSLAVAFTFLHEFRHVMLDFDDQRPKDRKEEELQADVWAREFMTVKLGDYAKAHGHNYQEVLSKRSMGLALAALILHEITPQHGGNFDYFSIKTRLTTLLYNTPLSDDDHFWRFAASLLVGIFRQRHLAFSPPPMAARALAEHLLNELPD